MTDQQPQSRKPFIDPRIQPSGVVTPNDEPPIVFTPPSLYSTGYEIDWKSLIRFVGRIAGFIIRLFRRADDELLTFEDLINMDATEKPKRDGKRKNDDKAKNDDKEKNDDDKLPEPRTGTAWR